MPYAEPFFHVIDRGVLCCASLLVPEKQRAEWRLEWKSELWHVRQSNGASAGTWQTECEIAEFCLGSFQDAACLQRLWWKNRPRPTLSHGSAMQCLFCLWGILLASFLFSLLSPGVRAAHDSSSDQVRPGTILIQDKGAKNSSAPTMTIDQVRNWEQSSQRYADGFAFYRVAQESVEIGTHISGTFRIAQASSNLFAVGGWFLRHAVPKEELQDNVSRLVLSDRMWRHQFGADPEIIGKILLVGSRRARIIGIAPSNTSSLPGNSDAWLLESNSEMGSNSRGYVIAHLTRSGRSKMWDGRLRIASYSPKESEHVFLGISLEEQIPGPWSIYWFGICLAFLSLPALTVVSIAEYSFNAHEPSCIHRAVRFSFAIAKIALILSIAYFASVDLAYWHFPAFSPSGTYIQLIVSFSIVLFGMRWALLDQRQRCPTCLKRVVHPAQVGLMSRMFLAWSGTELICTDGHTLLHIPGLPTSWFSVQRWIYLDSSWDFLFLD